MNSVTAPMEGTGALQVAVSPFVSLLVHNRDYNATATDLLDPGCETSLISKDLADILKLNGKRTNMKLATFHGRDPKLAVIKTRCQIFPTTNRPRLKSKQKMHKMESTSAPEGSSAVSRPKEF